MSDKKPTAKVSDGNVFAILGAAQRALKKAGKAEDFDKMWKRVESSGSYDEAIAIISEYVDLDLE